MTGPLLCLCLFKKSLLSLKAFAPLVKSLALLHYFSPKAYINLESFQEKGKKDYKSCLHLFSVQKLQYNHTDQTPQTSQIMIAGIT